jgi:hypothetical protein
MLIDQ